MAKVNKIVLKNVTICDLHSPYNGKQVDILIENQKILQIAEHIDDLSAQPHSFDGALLSPGWIDLQAQLGDPGFEHKEDLLSGLDAAAAGGFTAVCASPLTAPLTDSKSILEYKLNRARFHLVDILPLGILTEQGAGKNMAELFDMHHNGAVGFTDGKVQLSTSILKKSLMYLQQFGGQLMSHPTNASLSANGQVNESINSSLTGLKGIPALGEQLQISHDLGVLQYTGGKLHFSCISTASAVQLIHDAKKKGLAVSCDIAAHQVAFDDSVVNTFDTSYKVFPPFRTKDDVAALLKGLIDGTIDAVCSDHHPEDPEHKNVEFDLASFGIIGLQTAFAVLNTQLKKHLPTDKIVEKFTAGPRRVLGLPAQT
ncbi:MAG TPA: dihydroorotase, partial [Luteibaculaceae bacterium]|nr:dihydroorotase [Luteibaculaceae bacterium]